MPRIPTVQADDALREPSQSRPASPEMFGAGVGQALEELGSSVTGAITKLNDINNEVQAHRAITQAQKELGDYQQELKTGPVNDGSQVDAAGTPLPVGSPQIDSATGLPVGPPPPEKHAELMQAKIDDIRERYGNSFGALGGSASRMFAANFDERANAHLLETKAHAVSLLNQKIDSQFQLDLQNRANNAVSADPLVRHTSEHETEQYIDRMVQSGVITPEEGFRRKENFVEQVELGTIRNIMKAPLRPDGTSGATDVMRAIDDGEFNGLKADVLQRNKEIAINQQHTNLTRSIQETEFAQHQEEHVRKEADRTSALALTALLGQRKLTPQIVQSYLTQGKLSPESAMMFTKAAAGGDTLPSDGATKFGLANKIFNGEDVTQELNAAGASGRLSPNDYIELRQKQAEYANSFKANPAAKESMEWIHGMMGGDSLTKLPGQNAAEANVKQAFQDYVHSNPNATPDQLRDQAEALIRRGSIFDKTEMTTTMMAPRFSQKSKADLISGNATHEDMQQAYDATVAANKKGLLSDADMKREKNLIVQWSKMVAPPAAVKVKK